MMMIRVIDGNDYDRHHDQHPPNFQFYALHGYKRNYCYQQSLLLCVNLLTRYPSLESILYNVSSNHCSLLVSQMQLLNMSIDLMLLRKCSALCNKLFPSA